MAEVAVRGGEWVQEGAWRIEKVMLDAWKVRRRDVPAIRRPIGTHQPAPAVKQAPVGALRGG